MIGYTDWFSPQDLIGTAVSLVAFMQTMGGVVGYTIFTGVAHGRGHQTVPYEIGASAVKAGLSKLEVSQFVQVFYNQGAGAAAKLPGVTATILEAAGSGQQWGYSLAYSTMYYSQIPFGVGAVLLCIALPSISKLMTDTVVIQTQ